MTDNEKAATFIGWIPCGRPSADVPFPHPYPDYDYDPKTKLFQCKFCNRAPRDDLRFVHGICPDMSRPDNYMWAFEVLCSRPEIKWGISSGWIKGKSYTTYAIELITGPDASRVIKLAGTPVEALAALYDKEISHE